MSESGNGGCRDPSSVRKACVACGKKRGDPLLDCVGAGCPVAFHVKCYPLDLKSDRSRNFLCPYCSFKAATLRVDEVKKKANLAKQTMLRFVGAAGKEAQGLTAASVSNHENQGKDVVPLKGTGAPADFVAGAGVSGHSKEAQRQNDTPASENGNQGNVVAPPKGTGAPAREGPCIEKEMADAERSSPPKQSAKRARKSVVPIVKRKRLHWTDQEVETLEEGVRKFSEGNKNLPWRKILEFGSGTFDSTRAPIDLQNKWKNIQKRNTKGSSVRGSPGHND